MSKLLMWDEEGEPWLDNPQLLIANPRKRGRKMAMRRRRRARRNPEGPGYYDADSASDVRSYRTFSPAELSVYGGGGSSRTRKSKRKRVRSKMAVARRKRRVAVRRRRVRHVRKFVGRASTGFARKFRRRKVYRGTLRAGKRRGRVRFKFNRRHYRRNPGSAFTGMMQLPFGLSAPAIKDVAFGAAGLFVPGMITSKVMPYLPTSFMTGTIGTVVTWLVKVASVLVPGMLIKKYVDPRAGYAFMIGGAASLAVDAIRTFLPSVASTVGLSGQPLLGYYPGGVVQKGMGAYFGGAKRQVPMSTTPVLSGVPSRLNPAERF